MIYCSDESLSSVGSISDLEERLRPVHVKRSSQQSLNGSIGGGGGGSTTRTVVFEKEDNSPRYADNEVNSNSRQQHKH